MDIAPGLSDLRKIAGKTVLVTGGTGFIGSHIVNVLRTNCDVIVLSRKTKTKGVQTVIADITRESEMEKALSGIDIDLIFHAAGNTNTPFHTSEIDHFSINSRGTRNILSLAVKKDVSQVIYSSSMEVYESSQALPITEDHPAIPVSNYGISKWSGEHYCSEFSRHYGLNTTILRYSYVYGPRLPSFRVVSRFISNILEGKSIVLNNAGKSTTDYVFVMDVVISNILAATKDSKKCSIFNIGSGIETSVERLAQEIVEILGLGSLQYNPPEQKKPDRFVLDISKAKNELGYSPAFSLREGLKEQIQYLVQPGSGKQG